MPNGTCSIPGCPNPLCARGWCDKHYRRWKKYGDPLIVKVLVGADKSEERFWQKVDKTDSCWFWTESVAGGYGHFRFGGKVERAHRVSWVLAGGTLIEGMELDHLCRNTTCVRPSHLDQVTPRTNKLRGQGAAAQANRKSHCPQGHEYTPENTYRQPGNFRHRQCVICMRAKSKVNGMLEPAPIIPCPVCGTPFKARKDQSTTTGRRRTCSTECGQIIRWMKAS